MIDEKDLKKIKCMHVTPDGKDATEEIFIEGKQLHHCTICGSNFGYLDSMDNDYLQNVLKHYLNKIEEVTELLVDAEKIGYDKEKVIQHIENLSEYMLKISSEIKNKVPDITKSYCDETKEAIDDTYNKLKYYNGFFNKYKGSEAIKISEDLKNYGDFLAKKLKL